MAVFGGFILVAAGAMVSGLAVAGARTGGVGIGAGLLCADIFVVGDGESGVGLAKVNLVVGFFFFLVICI